MKRPDVDL
ncbi:d5e376a4-e765-4f7f-a194-d0d8fc78b69d [Thermothielavioides terrestris]|uniref:D5e376a4-e765-4f7f-a194-d0d8fc78b69d n=1 Tax=Thermothielavioides terrestris TaxID=2587410 RepID=A0A3S4DAR5_9PEZI|nr:d5e376a4-e765-4f7f-a194-d0d8fc78b69d [Thermothielavioides terrestris]